MVGNSPDDILFADYPGEQFIQTVVRADILMTGYTVCKRWDVVGHKYWTRMRLWHHARYYLCNHENITQNIILTKSWRLFEFYRCSFQTLKWIIYTYYVFIEWIICINWSHLHETK